MVAKDIAGLLTLRDSNGDVIAQERNVSFRYAARARTIYRWNFGYGSQGLVITTFPWKCAGLVTDDDINVGHSVAQRAAGSAYPNYGTTSSAQIGTYTYPTYRMTGAVGTIASSLISRVFGSVVASSTVPTTNTYDLGSGDDVLSQVDIPIDYTQIGTAYFHPAHQQANPVATTTGQSYLTYTAGSFWDALAISPGVFSFLRIETGADAGLYILQHRDGLANRIYLQCLDGSAFSASATASGLTATAAPGRRAWFNETSIIRLSVGGLSASGYYNPRKTDPYLRESFVLRLTLEKTGSTETAAGSEQQGSYLVSLKPFTHGEGALDSLVMDDRSATSCYLASMDGNTGIPAWVNFFSGGVNGIALDWENQRLWFGYTDSSNRSGIGHWRYKTTDGFREVANYLGTARQASMLNGQIKLGAGDVISSVELSKSSTYTGGSTYIGIYHATGGNGGLALIDKYLGSSQYSTANGAPASTVGGILVDSTRARTLDSTNTVYPNILTDSAVTGTFDSRDIGRVILFDTDGYGYTSDSGWYLIASVINSHSVTVTGFHGEPVTFNGDTGWRSDIGDRIYLFFGDASTGAGKLNYTESIAPSFFFSKSLTMTNGATIALRTPGSTTFGYGQKQACTIDAATGDLYWISTDIQQQVNKYDAATNTHSYRTLASIQTPSGGSPSNPGSATVFTAVHVNSKFNDIWLGTDQGHVKLLKSDFTGVTHKRYFGSETPAYENPVGFKRSDGSGSSSNGGSNSRVVRSYGEGADGRMYTMLRANGGAVVDVAYYSQESDNWCWRGIMNIGGGSVETPATCYDAWGHFVALTPSAGSGVPRFTLGNYEIEFQWNSASSKWVPKEWIRSGMPNKSITDTANSNAKARPIHSTEEEVLFGVNVSWNKQGGATPPNSEFLGRGGQTRTTVSDGTTTAGSAAFGGSGFTLGDVGKLLRVESGADTNLYKIAAYTSSSSVTLSRMNGTALAAAATSGGVTYTVWDLGTPGATAGPENITILLADGFSKDNTQDLTGITYESFGFKTKFYENVEPVKCVADNPISVTGTNTPSVYYETYPRAVPQYDAALSHHRALPASPITGGTQLLDWMQDKVLDGAGSRSNLNSSPANSTVWNGTVANTGVLGASVMVDLGKDVDVGFVQLRIQGQITTPSVLFSSATAGLVANLYNAPDSGVAPAISSQIRTSGISNLNAAAANTTTLTLGTGDFLGSISLAPRSDGAITAGQRSLSVVATPFAATRRGQILKVVSGAGADIGSYRVVSVASNGLSLIVRNLDQTDKLWSVSATGVTFELWDGVREEDMLAIPSLAAPVHKLCVERLLTANSVQVRTGPNTTVTSQNWQCVAPNWSLTKRLSYSTEALPPDVKNNGTWVSVNGRNNYDSRGSVMYFDLTDLPAAQRTGRWWKWTGIPRFATAASGDNAFSFTTMEFYDTSGNKIGVGKNTSTQETQTNRDFYFNYLNRVDFVQASFRSDAHGASTFASATIGGTKGDTVTLTPNGRFLGYKIGPTVLDGAVTAGTNTFNSASSSWPAMASVGRFLQIRTAPYLGTYYRITARPSATQVTVTTPSGGAVSWPTTAGSLSFSIHEGINAGGAYPDKIIMTAEWPMPVPGKYEYSISTINDALTVLTVAEGSRVPYLGLWQIVRPAYDTASAATEAAKSARIVRPALTYPVQSGDIAQDSRGHFVFFGEDIGAGFQRTDGSTTGFQDFYGSNFTVDDIGRLLYIETGPNKGVYAIWYYYDATHVLLNNYFTGVAATLTVDAGPITYRVRGDRYFKLTKYCTGLRA